MGTIILTQYQGAILGPIARVLGWLTDLVYKFLDNVCNIQNVALTIFLFTLLIYLCLLPLTYKQQKFSKMSQVMNPELQKIQKKYKGRRDQESMALMNQETQALYAKYGVSPSGSCVYLIIQMPILFALYRVITNIPAYVSGVKDVFTDLVNSIMATPGYQDTMTSFYDSISSENSRVFSTVSLNFTGTEEEAANSIIDVLYKCTSSNWDALASAFPDSVSLIETTQAAVNHFNNFLGVNISYTPANLVAIGFSTGAILTAIIAICIPLFSALTQYFNIWLMPTPQTNNQAGGNTMKTMNYLMPIYSLILVLFLPVGVGIYWISGALIRCVQQIIFNRHFNRINMDEMVKKNQEKAKKKLEKKQAKSGTAQGTISSAAATNTRSIRTMSQKVASVKSAGSQVKTDDVSNVDIKSLKPGSMAAKAAIVSAYNQGISLKDVGEEITTDATSGKTSKKGGSTLSTEENSGKKFGLKKKADKTKK